MKFFNATAAFLAAALPLANAAFTIVTPTNWNASSLVTLNWTAAATDSVFSVELLNSALQFGALALLNNVNPTQGQAAFALGAVPQGSGYTVEFVNVANISLVLASSSTFSIGAPYGNITTTPVTAPPTAVPGGATSAPPDPSPSSNIVPFNAGVQLTPKLGALGGAIAAGIAIILF